MKIEIICKNYNLKDNFKNIINKKVEKLSKYFDDNVKATVFLKRDGDIFKLEFTILNKKTIFRSEKSSDNMYENLDIVLPKVERQIIKAFDKSKDKERKKSLQDIVKKDYDEEIIPKKQSKVVKIKQFDLFPLTDNEAEENFEAIGHDFYIYLSKETGRVKLLYTRKDGNKGLIETNY